MIPPERYESLGELLRDALVQYKSEVALIEANRKQEARRLTYLELMRESDRVARYLEDAGVGAGARVLRHDGRAFTAANINEALALRDLMADLRAANPLGAGGGAKPFAKADRARFLEALERELRALKRPR